MTTCFGYKGRKWIAGEIVELDPSDPNIPRHIVSLEKAPEEVKTVPHRTEAQEMPLGKNRDVVGGMNAGLEKTKVPRIPTVKDIPNNVVPKVKLKRGRPKKS